MQRRRGQARGEEIPTARRCASGCPLATVLVVLLVAPMVFFSTAAPFSSSNRVASAQMHLGVSILLSPDPASSAFASLLPRDEAQQGGAYSLGSISHFELSPLPRSDKILSTPFRLYRCLAARQQNDTAAALEACGYDYLLSDRLNADFQLLRMRADTEWLWNVNSEVLHAQWKAYAAANASSLQLEARLLLVREQDSGRPAEVSATSRLNSSEAEAFWLAAARGRGGVPCANFFPKFVRLTATEPKLLTSDNDAWHTRQSLAFAISSATSASADGDGDGDNDSDAPPQRYWSLRQAAADPSPFGAAAGDGVQLVVAADRMIIPDDSPIAELAEGGIIAFYLVVVLTIANCVRAKYGGKRTTLVEDETPETSDLLDLCDGVYIARREKALVRETEFFEIILRLYRSPESLLQLTGARLKYRNE